MREQVADQDPLLAARLELRPVRAHRCVQVEQPALVQQQGHGGGHALGRGADDLRGVLRPGIRAVGVLGAAPQVDDLAAVAVDGHGRAAVPEHLEIARERVPDGLEALRHRPVDIHVYSQHLPRRPDGAHAYVTMQRPPDDPASRVPRSGPPGPVPGGRGPAQRPAVT